MDHTFPVTVVDDKAATVAGATVSLVTKSGLGGEFHPYPSLKATHNDKGGGIYTEKAKIVPTPGAWFLVVKLKGKSVVVQPLNLKEGAKGEFTAAATPRPVATVTITSSSREVIKVTKKKEIAFHVTLHPAAEIAFIGGLDYSKRDVSGGWLFHVYGFNRAEILRREKKIHAGTIVTVFSTANIWRTTRVWGGTKWVDIEVKEIADPATRLLGGDTYVPEAGIDIHITDFYKHLSAVGTREPGSVQEIGIFSHSFPGGPILYNTGEESANAGLAARRDPTDFDARPKDFNAVNFADYDKMAAALASGCRFTIWGCSATTHFKFRSRAALRAIRAGLAEDDFFVVNSAARDNHDPTVGVYATWEENTSELRHRFMMDLTFRAGTYPAEAAKKLKIEVRSGCPGTGSDPAKVDGIEMLMVSLSTYKHVFEYFREKFGPEFAETTGKWDKGYIDYNAIQSRTPVPRPPFSTQYYDLRVKTKVTRWNPVAEAILGFWKSGITVTHPSPNVRMILSAKTGLAKPGKKGHLMILKDRKDSISQAVFVQEDEKIFKVTRDAKGEWTVIGAEL